MMYEQETLFDMFPEEKTGEIEKTEIEHLQLAFDKNKKMEFLKNCEKLLPILKLDNYTELISKLVKEKYEDYKS
mgnify:CR=1 FL=1|tara:strand:+ start:219 stop:440 length:222 start_codon:yes stop_codon:yes gene_type:complete